MTSTSTEHGCNFFLEDKSTMNGSTTIDYLRFCSCSLCVWAFVCVCVCVCVGNLASQEIVHNDCSKQIYLICSQFDDNEWILWHHSGNDSSKRQRFTFSPSLFCLHILSIYLLSSRLHQFSSIHTIIDYPSISFGRRKLILLSLSFSPVTFPNGDF